MRTFSPIAGARTAVSAGFRAGTRSAVAGGLLSKILLALDDSPCAPRVAAAGGLIAARFGSSLHPVRVIDRAPGANDLDAPELQRATASLQELARSLVDAMVAAPRVRIGEPWRVLLEMATELQVDGIVLGARGHGTDALGSTVSSVLVHASQDVYVVRNLLRRTQPP